MSNFPTAAAEKINSLYRYQPFNEEWLYQLVVGSTLHFASPNDFNDPWDCKVWFDDDLSNTQTLENYLNFYIRSSHKQAPEIPLEVFRERANFFRANPLLMKKNLPEISRAVSDEIYKRYKICCLSTYNHSELMWAHYARNHTGICLEFDTKNKIFCSALRVSYLNDCPIHDLSADNEEDNLKIFLSKSASWAYENEYRIIAREMDEYVEPDLIRTQNSLLKFPSRALKSIIFGCRTSLDNRKKFEKSQISRIQK